MEITATPVCNSHDLLTLPQELQDIIFNFAYPRLPGFSIVSKTEWQAAEEFRRIMHLPSRYNVAPFPPHAVDRLLVSKHVFINAAKAYIGNQRWSSTGRRHDDGFFHCLSTGVNVAFIVELELKLHECVRLAMLRNLKDLTVRVEAAHFAMVDVEPRYEVLTQWELENVAYVAEDLLEMRGLQRLSLVAGDVERFPSVEVSNMWKRNTERLGSLIKEVVTAPACAEETTQPNRNGSHADLNICSSGSDQSTLYVGSLVCWGSSERLPDEP